MPAHRDANEPFSTNAILTIITFHRNNKAPVTKRRGIGPIRTEISSYKIRKKVVYFPNC